MNWKAGWRRCLLRGGRRGRGKRGSDGGRQKQHATGGLGMNKLLKGLHHRPNEGLVVRRRLFHHGLQTSCPAVSCTALNSPSILSTSPSTINEIVVLRTTVRRKRRTRDQSCRSTRATSAGGSAATKPWPRSQGITHLLAYLHSKPVTDSDFDRRR